MNKDLNPFHMRVLYSDIDTDGVLLEDILTDIVHDLMIKNLKLIKENKDYATSVTHNNNIVIIDHLISCIDVQNATMLHHRSLATYKNAHPLGATD